MQTGVDAGLGALILDAVRADVYSSAFHALTSRLAQEEASEPEQEEKGEDAD
ncbi:hypothetical protein EVA_13685 [gut metagenome]|uniref:Uncharacterized protein n=1 Tax=gut metagenome TaxID=749906 RepID=J9FUM6_9ZZZZ